MRDEPKATIITFPNMMFLQRTSSNVSGALLFWPCVAVGLSQLAGFLDGMSCCIKSKAAVHQLEKLRTRSSGTSEGSYWVR